MAANIEGLERIRFVTSHPRILMVSWLISWEGRKRSANISTFLSRPVQIPF